MSSWSQIAGPVLLAALLSTSAARAGEALELEVRFADPSLSVDAAGYTHVSLPGAPDLGRPGEPALPVRQVLVALPPGAEVLGVEVELLGSRALPGYHEVFPAQPPRPLSLPAPDFVPPDPAVYRAEGLFPAAAFEARPAQLSRGVSVLPVAVWPVRAEPSLRRLWFAPRARVTVRVEAGKATSVYRGRSGDLARTARLVENPGVLERYPLERGKADDARYVVVTAAALVGCPGDFGLEALLAEKQLRGLSTRLATVDEIRAGYPGRDTPEKIRAFLADMHTNHGAEYVLLAGDADGALVGGETEAALVPARMLWGDIGFGVDDVPSDLYYACLDGDFDANHNNVFGEGGDAPDLMAELDVGRAPVDSCAEVENFVRKTLAYQATQAAYLQRVQFAGEWLWDGYGDYDWAKTFLEQIHYSSDELLPTLGFDQSSFYQVTTMYDRDLGGADSWGPAEILGVLNANPHLVNHLGHSYTNYALRLTTDQLMAGIANSLPFLVYTQGCYPGAFDNRLSEYDNKAVQPQDSFAEHMLLDELGAFAAVMNTRYGLGWTSNYYHRTFWDALFRAGERHLGGMQSYSRDALAGYVPGDDGMRWIHYDCNLFGDPELELKTSASSEPLLGVPAAPIRLREVLGQGAPRGGVLPVRNDGLGTLTFEVVSHATWLAVIPTAGTAPAEVALAPDLTGLGAGLYTAELTVSSPEAPNSPQQVVVELELLELPALVVPFVASAPSVDGVLRAGEWDAGARIDLAPGAPGRAVLHLAHDGARLVLALEVAEDTSPEEYDMLHLTVDSDGNRAWPRSPGAEGLYYVLAYPGESYFLPFYQTPSGAQQGEWEYYPSGFVASAGTGAAGRVMEASFDLDASHLRREPGQAFGLELDYYDYASGAMAPEILWPGLSQEYDPGLFSLVTLGISDAFTTAPAALALEAEEGGGPSAALSLAVGTQGGAGAGFELEASAAWLRSSADLGTSPAALEVWAEPAGLAPGEHQAVLTLTGTGAAMYLAPLEVPVLLTVVPACVDLDQDGFLDAACGGDDCDDLDAQAHPGAEELCGDEVDQDCDGEDEACPCPDADQDGHQDFACGGDDCDDEVAAIHPGAEERCGDGVDQDCSGADAACPCPDADQDGFTDAVCGGTDCDDLDAGAHPGAQEVCGDSLDQDCSGADLACEPEPEPDDPGSGCATGGSPADLGWALLLLGFAVRRRVL